MREEHVDGGYMVTQGVYTGTEDYSKGIVRSADGKYCLYMNRLQRLTST